MPAHRQLTYSLMPPAFQFPQPACEVHFSRLCKAHNHQRAHSGLQNHFLAEVFRQRTPLVFLFPLLCGFLITRKPKWYIGTISMLFHLLHNITVIFQSLHSFSSSVTSLDYLENRAPSPPLRTCIRRAHCNSEYLGGFECTGWRWCSKQHQYPWLSHATEHQPLRRRI